MFKKSINLGLLFVLFAGVILGVISIRVRSENEFKHEYGIFLGIDSENIAKMKSYQTIVIDAAYFTKGDIAKLHKKGHTIYSYLNVGALETFRPYYDDYSKFVLGKYENWEGEYWVDISKKQWQELLVKTLAKDLVNKGIDGFFLDNADVCYQYPRPEIYQGFVSILTGLKQYKKSVIINGGDTVVSELLKKDDSKQLIDGINQETVLTSINFSNQTFETQKASTTDYYKKYFAECEKNNIKIYLLEYSKSKIVECKVANFCRKNGYIYYVSPSLELNGNS